MRVRHVIRVGFTGSSRGMTDAQSARVLELVGHRLFYAVHGDCVGGDAEFDRIVRKANGLYGVLVHPSDLVEKRAFVNTRYPHDVVHEPLPPLVRNQNIVDDVVAGGPGSFLIAAPKSQTPTVRSGTWSTVRRAQAARLEIAFCFPNGTLVWDYHGDSFP